MLKTTSKNLALLVVLCALLFPSGLFAFTSYCYNSDTGEVIPVQQNDSHRTLDRIESSGVSANGTSSSSLPGVLSQFEDIQKVLLDGVVSSSSNNVITLENIRILSSTTNLNDYIAEDFLLDAQSMQLLPYSTYISKNLKVYNIPKCLFSKDVPSIIYLRKPDGTQLASDVAASITANRGDIFKMSLEGGTVLSYHIWNPSDDVVVTITAPGGTVLSKSAVFAKSSNWYWVNLPMVKTGLYKITFVPQNSSSVSFDFSFTNQNRTTLMPLSTGDNISTTLDGIGYQYSKYLFQLKAGDTVTLSQTASSVYLYLVDSTGFLVTYIITGPLNYKVDYAGRYYLFIAKKDVAYSASYSSPVTITPDPNRSKYPVLKSVQAPPAHVGQSYALQLEATNSPSAFIISGLPYGLSYNNSTGKIHGTPTLAGTYPICAVAKNKFGSDREDFLLTIR